MLNDINITKLSGGLGRRAPEGDMISGLLAGGVAVTAGVQLETVYRLASLQDALLLGIDADYDTTHAVLVYEHIKEFFRVNPNGELYLMLLPRTVDYAAMLDPANTGNAKKLLVEAGGNIRQLGVAFNPEGTVPAIWTQTLAAIAKAQELATDEYTLHRPVEILLEGKDFDISATVDFRSLNAPNVAVMLGQAMSIASQPAFAKYAAIGTLLGAVSKARVNESIAWVERFNLYGGTLEAIGLGGESLNTLSQGDLNTLDENGAIFFRTHAGTPGIYLNDSHTCTHAADDYAYIENNRTIHKAVRNIRRALLPRLASPVLIDQDSGQLSPEVVKSYESDGRRALETLLSNGEVSAIDVYVDPAQNILASGELKLAFSLIPTGTARRISVTIGFVNPF